MILTVLTMLLTYLATSIDEIPILFLFYTRAKRRGEERQITLSYYMGTFLLIGIGLLGARSLLLLPQRWMVGFIGLIPLILGIKILLQGEEGEIHHWQHIYTAWHLCYVRMQYNSPFDGVPTMTDFSVDMVRSLCSLTDHLFCTINFV